MKFDGKIIFEDKERRNIFSFGVKPRPFLYKTRGKQCFPEFQKDFVLQGKRDR